MNALTKAPETGFVQTSEKMPDNAAAKTAENTTAKPAKKTRTKSPRRVLIPLLLLAIAGGGYWLWAQHRPQSGPLVLQGNVEVRQVNLSFKVAGRIKQLLVDEGDRVTEGQLLAALDKVYFEDALAQFRAQRDQAAATLAKMQAGNRPEEIAQAEALVAQREATLTNANVTLDRAEQLLKSSSGTRKTYDDALAARRTADAQLNSARQALNLMRAGFRIEDIDAARAQFANAEATVAVAARQLSDAELFAPSNGVILSRVREAGTIANIGDTVFVASLTSPVFVRTYVSEPDLARIHPGQQVVLNSDAPGVKPLTGRVGFISTTAEFTPKTVETRELRTALVYRVRIVAEDPQGLLRQGMPMTATILDASPAAAAAP